MPTSRSDRPVQTDKTRKRASRRIPDAEATQETQQADRLQPPPSDPDYDPPDPDDPQRSGT